MLREAWRGSGERDGWTKALSNKTTAEEHETTRA